MQEIPGYTQGDLPKEPVSQSLNRNYFSNRIHPTNPPTHPHPHTHTRPHTHTHCMGTRVFPTGHYTKQLQDATPPTANQLPMVPSTAAQNGQLIIYIVKNDDNEVNITLVLLKLK